MSENGFRATSQSWRLFYGPQVIEQGLKDAVGRAGAKRAFVICSPSINRRTDTVRRIAAALGNLYGGVFDGIQKDCPYDNVCAAKDAAATANADLLIAVGGGSVIVATRAVAIFLTEPGGPFEIMTQYPEGKAAFSPRLLAPKPPIVNIPTTPTSAMNRAGTGLKNDDLDHRMEYYDPKTRPQAIFIDHDVLSATPRDVLRSTATTVFASTVGAMAHLNVNLLVEGDRNQAFRLAHRAYGQLADGRDDADLRAHLCIAAFLQNRAEDDGGRIARSATFSGDYAVSTALHVRYPHIGQGESTCVLQATKIRLSETIDLQSARQVAEAVGVWRDGMDGRQAGLAVADALEDLYRRVGMPIHIRDLGVPREDLPLIARQTVKNFNANASLRSADEQVANAARLLDAAY